MSEAKYRKGGQITSLDQIATQEYIFCQDQIIHREWFMSWLFGYANSILKAGLLFRADRKSDDG